MPAPVDRQDSVLEPTGEVVKGGLLWCVLWVAEGLTATEDGCSFPELFEAVIKPRSAGVVDLMRSDTEMIAGGWY